jgi:predicted tellurium resistance membrane protein TerC
MKTIWRASEFLSDFIEGLPTWARMACSLLLMIAGVFWCWGVGHYRLTIELAIPGCIAFAVGIVWLGLVLMSDDA